MLKTNSKNYMRDERTQALLNINDIEYQNILVLRKRNKQLNTVQKDLENLKDQMKELTDLIKKKE